MGLASIIHVVIKDVVVAREAHRKDGGAVAPAGKNESGVVAVHSVILTWWYPLTR